MSFLSNLFRCLCLCVVIEKGTWYPNQKTKTSKNNRELAKRQLYNPKSLRIDKELPSKPAWLKEWTISKGWVHNKSHMLELGTQNSTQKMQEINYDNISQSSSISSQNIDELVSLESNFDKRQIAKQVIRKTETDPETEDSAGYTSEENETVRISSKLSRHDAASIFEQVSENYRNNFPECSRSYILGNFALPQVYKEQLLLREKKEINILHDIWKHLKPKKNRSSSYECRFTENQLFDNKDIFNTLKSINSEKNDTIKSTRKTNLAKNIALYNDLNSRRNLHEETIYECSEENSIHTSLNNIYYNPIYSHAANQQISVYDRRMQQYQKHLKYFHDHNDSHKMRSDKYIIRHIRVRIMLSLRVGKLQKAKKSQDKKRTIFGGKSKNNRKAIENDGHLQLKAAKMHDEQRRIGNGKTSIKIQNMRYIFQF